MIEKSAFLEKRRERLAHCHSGELHDLLRTVQIIAGVISGECEDPVSTFNARHGSPEILMPVLIDFDEISEFNRNILTLIRERERSLHLGSELRHRFVVCYVKRIVLLAADHKVEHIIPRVSE